MYVCICNRYRDSEISEVARTGVRCAFAVYDALGAAPRCGRCIGMAQDLIDRTLAERTKTEQPACPAHLMLEAAE